MDLKDLIKFKDSQFIFDVLFQRDKTARFVGGCIRNALLNSPVTDIDIGTVLYPDEVEKMFSEYSNIKVIDIGKEYGTIMIVLNHNSYEITTLRKDVHTDGRYAVVEYTEDWQEDASRRDFTINGMSYSPKENKLYDYFNGQNDLKKGLIKFIGDPEKRVQEDYLRILRLFRFYSYHGKIIDEASLIACRKYAESMKHLSQERKMTELYKILINKRYLETLRLMEQNQIVAHISILPNWHVGIVLCENLEKICSDYQYKLAHILKIFALFYEMNISSSRIAKEFITLSKEEKKYLTVLSKFISDTGLDKIIDNIHYHFYYYSDVLVDGFLYMQARELQRNHKLKYDKNSFTKILDITKLEIPIFPITGSDLISEFSLSPGKKLGNLLEVAKNFWIESKFEASKEDILIYIKKFL